MQNVTNVTVGDKQYKKVGNQAESYKFYPESFRYQK